MVKTPSMGDSAAEKPQSGTDYFQPKDGGTRPRDAEKRERRLKEYDEGLKELRRLFGRLVELKALADAGEDWRAVGLRGRVREELKPPETLEGRDAGGPGSAEKGRGSSQMEQAGRERDGERGRCTPGDDNVCARRHGHDDGRISDHEKRRSRSRESTRKRRRRSRSHDRENGRRSFRSRSRERYRGGERGRSYQDKDRGEGVKPPQGKGHYYHNLNAEDCHARRGFGSSRAVYDRKKFEREFDHKAFLAKLPEDQQEVYRANPHIRQVFVNGYEFRRSDGPMTQHDRLLTPDKGRTPYSRRTGEAKTVEHWGQRKLLLSEIEFLTLYGRAGSLVVYAGAAPGSHTNILAAGLFPDVNFVLVDPANFDAWETERLKIVSSCFTDEMAEGYKSPSEEASDKLLISDIRSTIPNETPQEEFERRVMSDMEVQARWTRLMRPRAAMLKFRLPYNIKQFPEVEYLDGDVFLPIWGPRTTTECRLVVTDPDGSRTWDSQDYESAMFHFNTTTRVTYFEHAQGAEGYDHCYDCAAEALVLSEYIRTRHGITDPGMLREAVDELSETLSRLIGWSRKSLKIDGIDRI